MPTRHLLTLLVLLLCAALAGCSSRTTDHADPASVILIIGDGMDQQQLTIARNYLAGSRQGLTIDTLPRLSSVRVQTLATEHPERFAYVADSANTATTLASGVLTSRGRISRDATGKTSLPTILEQARTAGLGTGLVTTSSLTDATTAAFASHSKHRKCQNPDSLSQTQRWYPEAIDCRDEAIDRGGPGSIAHQLANADITVMLGGGRREFSRPGFGGEASPLESAEKNRYQLVSTGEEMAAATLDQPLLGLFAPGHFPVQMMGENRRKAEAIDLDSEPVLAAEVFSCIEDPRSQEVPSLRAMTDKALAILGSNNSAGFFLMIESASIDKQSHARQPCGHIGEVQQLDQALQSALAYGEGHPNTLILVTADHAHAAQIIPDQESFVFEGNSFHSPGLVARIRTPEGSIMMVNYATTNLGYEMHTGTNVPLYAIGPGVENIPSYLTQADIYQLMKSHLGL